MPLDSPRLHSLSPLRRTETQGAAGAGGPATPELPGDLAAAVMARMRPADLASIVSPNTVEFLQGAIKDWQPEERARILLATARHPRVWIDRPDVGTARHQILGQMLELNGQDRQATEALGRQAVPLADAALRIFVLALQDTPPIELIRAQVWSIRDALKPAPPEAQVPLFGAVLDALPPDHEPAFAKVLDTFLKVLPGHRPEAAEGGLASGS